VLRLAFAFDQNGSLPWDTILYSCIKKSGKTTLNGALTLAWGFTQEAPNEILILANDLEQTLARVFRTMEGIIQHNPELQREAEVQSRTIYLAGTAVAAISHDGQRKTLRPGTYLRLYENRWVTAEGVFITPEIMWNPCVNQAHHPTIISLGAKLSACAGQIPLRRREPNRHHLLNTVA
jgi:hypothetical protein